MLYWFIPYFKWIRRSENYFNSLSKTLSLPLLFRFQIDPDDSHKDFKRLERWLCARPTDYQGLQYSTLVISEYKNPFVNLRWWELWIKMSCKIFFILLWYWISRTMCARFYLGFCIFCKNLLQNENKRQITFLWHELWENRWIFLCWVHCQAIPAASHTDKQAHLRQLHWNFLLLFFLLNWYLLFLYISSLFVNSLFS